MRKPGAWWQGWWRPWGASKRALASLLRAGSSPTTSSTLKSPPSSTAVKLIALKSSRSRGLWNVSIFWNSCRVVRGWVSQERRREVWRTACKTLWSEKPWRGALIWEITQSWFLLFGWPHSNLGLALQANWGWTGSCRESINCRLHQSIWKHCTAS